LVVFKPPVAQTSKRMPPLHDHLHDEGSPPADGGPPLDEIANVLSALAPGAPEGEGVDQGLALLAHILQDHSSDATTVAVLLSGAVPRLFAALQSPRTSTAGCVEGLRALVMLTDVRMRDPLRRVGAASSDAPPPNQQHDPDHAKCEVCNADKVAAHVCTTVVGLGAPRAAVEALRLHPDSSSVAYFGCAALFFASGVDQRARDKRRDVLKAVGAHAAVIAAARRFPRDLQVAQQAASALFTDGGGRAAAIEAGGVALLLEMLEALAPNEESDWLVGFISETLLHFECKENFHSDGAEVPDGAVPAEAVAPLVRAIALLGANAGRSSSAVSKAACALANIAGSVQHGDFRAARAARTDRYLVAVREGAARHILVALETHMHSAEAVSELLQALSRVAVESRDPLPPRPGAKVDNRASTELMETQMGEYEALIAAGAVPLVVRALAAHADNERASYLAAATLGELYSPAWTMMTRCVKALAAAGLRPEMTDEGGARALARALVLHGADSKYVRTNATAAFEETRCSSLRLKALLRAEGASAALAEQLLKNFRNVCESCGEHGKGFSFCAACMLVAYCGRACQRDHWRDHKAACGAASAAKKAAS